MAVEGPTPYKDVSQQDRYVPSLSIIPSYTDTSQVRGNALDFVGLTQLSIRRSTSFCSVMTSQLLKDAPSGSPSPLRTIAEIESTSSTTDQRSATGQLLKDAYPGLPLRTSIEIESISSTYERSATSQLPKDTPSGSPSQTIAEIDSISSTYEHSATSPLLKEAPSRSPLQTVTEIDSISSMTDQRSATGQLLKDAHTGSPLRNIIEIDSISSTNRRSATSQLPKDTHSGSPLQTIAEIDCISSTYERSATSVLLEAPSGSPLQAIAEVDSISSTNQRTATSLLLKDALSGSPLRTNIEIDTISSTNQRSTSAETYRQEAHGRRCSSHEWILSPKRRFGEPDGVRCDGWCKHDLTPCATVVSAISAWWDDEQATNDTFSRLRHTDSCLCRHARTHSVLGKAHGVRSRPCCAASSVSAPCSEYGLFRATNLTGIWSQRKTPTHHTAR